jgi:hypothetical protein
MEIKVNANSSTITVDVVGNKIVKVVTLGAQGPVGAQGPQGVPGPGVPEGGAEFDLIEKASGTEYDTRWTNKPTIKGARFSTTDAASLDQAGDLAWDDLDQALAYRTNGLTIDIGQENLVYVRNPSGGATIPKGAAVAVDGASSNRLQVKPCDSTVGGDGCATLGVAMGDIPSPGFGFVSTFGMLRGFDTGNIIGGGVAPGVELFISSTPGVLSTQPQSSPGRRVTVGYVVTTGNNGSIFVTVRRGLTVNELDNVLAANPQDGQVIRYSAADARYNLSTLGTAADAATTDFATAAQGTLADSALQAGDNVSSLTNDAGYVDATGAAAAAPVQSVNSKTGTVTLSAADVGAYPDNNPSAFVDAAGAAAAAPVQSVNSQTGAVTLSASDVGAYPDNNPSGFIDAAGAPVQSVNGQIGTVSLDADDIGYDNTTSGLTGTDVQDAIDELAARPSGGGSADQVTYDNTTSGLLATNVQDAIDELVDFVNIVRVVHGSNSSLARPSINGVVLWQGTAIPANGIDGDLWDETQTFYSPDAGLWVYSGTDGAWRKGSDWASVAWISEHTVAAGGSVELNFGASTGDRTIDWGDGTVAVVNTARPTRTYTNAGTYKIRASGGTTTRLGDRGGSPVAAWTGTLIAVRSWGNLGWTSFLNGLQSVSGNFAVPRYVPSSVTNMSPCSMCIRI